MPLLVPGLDQISDGLVPVTSSKHSVFHLHTGLVFFIIFKFSQSSELPSSSD